MRGFAAALGALLLLVAPASSRAAGWEPPASPGPAGAVASIASVDAVAIAGVPHVAWVQDRVPRVARLTAGGTWEQLGAPVAAADAIAIAGGPDGRPYVLTTDDDLTTVTGARFSGTAWTAEPVSTGFTITARDPDVALINGTLWISTVEQGGSAPIATVVRERTAPGTFAARSGLGANTDRAKLLEHNGTAHVAFRLAQTVSDARVSAWNGASWVAVGPATGSLDGVNASGLQSVDAAVVDGALHAATARTDGVRVRRLNGATWDLAGQRTGTAASTVALRPALAGGFLAWASGTQTTVARVEGDALTDLGGGPPSGALTPAPALGLTTAGGVPVLAASETTGVQQTVGVRHLVPDFVAPRFTSTTDSVTLTTSPNTFGATLPIGFQRSGGAVEGARTFRGAGFTDASHTVGGLAPSTEVPWRPVLSYGPFVFGPPEGLARTQDAAVSPAPPQDLPPATPPPTTPPPTPNPPTTPTEPIPTLGRTAAVDATSGRVVVTRPGGKPQRLGERAGLLPIGTKVDVTRGRVELWFATPDGKGQYRGFFYQGTFRIQSQDRRTGLVTFQLARPTQCGTSRKRARTAKKKKNKVWGDAKGKFRTRGRFAAATVRGTKWSTEDACDRTTVRVVNGVVDVQNLITKRTTRLRAGRSSTARRR